MATTTGSRFACLWCGQECASAGAVYRHIAEHHPDDLPTRSGPQNCGTKQRIIEFIKRYRAEHEYPPTVREIARAVGLASPATVHRHLVDLIEMGALERVPRRARTRWAADTASEFVPMPKGTN